MTKINSLSAEDSIQDEIYSKGYDRAISIAKKRMVKIAYDIETVKNILEGMGVLKDDDTIQLLTKTLNNLNKPF